MIKTTKNDSIWTKFSSTTVAIKHFPGWLKSHHPVRQPLWRRLMGVSDAISQSFYSLTLYPKIALKNHWMGAVLSYVHGLPVIFRAITLNCSKCVLCGSIWHSTWQVEREWWVSYKVKKCEITRRFGSRRFLLPILMATTVIGSLLEIIEMIWLQCLKEKAAG